MTIGQAYTHILTPSEQKALQISCDVLINTIFDDLAIIEESKKMTDMMMGTHLPVHTLPQYTPLFLRQFAVCLITVAWKLAQPNHMPLSSVAEMLAARAIIEQAKRILDTDENTKTTQDAFETFRDCYFEDLDFESLFDYGYECECGPFPFLDAPLAEIPETSPLAFANWFRPLSHEPTHIAHPYTENAHENTSQEQNPPPVCSFCHKSPNHISQIFIDPDDNTTICNRCVGI
jgi:hypothetical protein